MAVLSNTGTVTPVGSVETIVATIAPGTPLDNITVYVQGGQFGGGGPLEFALYTTVGGFQTRVAQMKLMGSATGTIIDWPSGKGPLSGGSGIAGETEDFSAGGTAYTVTVIDLSAGFGVQPRAPVTVTIAGVNSFDTVADQNFGQVFGLAPGQTGTLPTFNGYANEMDVAIDQTNLPPVTVTVTADCGIVPTPSVQAVVASVQMTGRDNDIAAVFQNLKLPVATRYFVSVTAGNSPVSATLTAITYSIAVTAGGVVVLNGDVIGPSNANTDIAWSNVPLNRVGPNSFAAPADAAMPIFNAGLGAWFAIVISGDGTISDTGVLTVTGGTITLAGDVTGPSDANTVVRWEGVPLNALTMGAPAIGDVPVFNADGTWHAATVSASIILGGDVIGPASANQVIKWDLVPLLMGVTPGSFDLAQLPDAAVPIFDIGTGEWRAFALSGGATMSDSGVVTINPATIITLTGNVNGPSNANEWTSFIVEATGAPVTIPNPANGGWTYIGVSGLAGPQMINLPLIPVQGMVIVITDEDGSLATQSVQVNGNGKPVEGVPMFTMNAAYPGSRGSICLQYDATATIPGWFIFADYAANATSADMLAGNANGPLAANTVEDFGIESVNANVTAAQFVSPQGAVAGEWYVGISAAVNNISVQLQDTFPPGSKVTVKDEDGSLANVDFIVTGSTGKTIDGAASFTMNLATPGPKGAITFEKNFNAPNEWGLV